MFFDRILAHLLPSYEHSDFHGGQIAFAKNQLCSFRLLLLPARGWFDATATIEQMPSATATVYQLAHSSPIVDRDRTRAWRSTSSYLLKGLGPLDSASLGKLSQGIEFVFAVGISRENLSGIVRWAFISLKQPLAYFFGRVKDLVGRH